jgi:hypothetical protein
MGLWDTAKRVGAGVATGGLSELYYNDALKKPARSGGEYEGVDKNNFVNPAYEGYNQSLGQFADERGGGPFRGQQQELGNMLMAQARGENSFSAEKLRQDAARMQGMQQSMAASAGPANKAMAIRNAQANSGQIGVGMAGNAALAGIQERTAAANAAGNVLGGARGQDISAYLGAQGQLGQNAATQLQGTMGYEQNRTSRYGAAMGVPTYGEVGLGALTGLGGLMAGKSDIRAKKNVEPLAPVGIPRDELKAGEVGKMTKLGKTDPTRKFYESTAPTAERDLDEFLTHGARPYRFEYEQGEGQPGKHVGPMAQNLAKVAPEAVVEDKSGTKFIDYSKAGPVMMAAQGYLKRKVDALEQALTRREGGPSNRVDMSQGSMREPVRAVEKLAGPRVYREPNQPSGGLSINGRPVMNYRVHDPRLEEPLMSYTVNDPRKR